MSCFLTVLSVLLGAGKNITSKLGKNYFSEIHDCAKLNIVTSVIALLVFVPSVGNSNTEYGFIFLTLSFLYGLCTFFSQLFYIKAVKTGPVSVCSLIYSCGFIIPTIFAAAVFSEKVTPLKAVGIILLIFCTFAVGYKKERSESYGWLLPACLAMLSSGAVGVLQKAVRKCFSSWCMDEYLFWAFGFMLVLSVAVMLLSKSSKGERSLKYFLCTAFLAICVVGANKLNLYLSGIVPGVIFFPAVNGGCLVVSSIMSKLIFNESFSAVKICGLTLSVLSIILIANG